MNEGDISNIAFFIAILSLLASFFAIWKSRSKSGLSKILNSKNHPQNLEEIIDSISLEIKNHSQNLQYHQNLLEQIQEILAKSVKHVHVTRYNAAHHIGGNLSFSIAMLDSLHNGIVITSLHSTEFNRIYAKPIKGGASQYTLSSEEKEAVINALTNK